MGGLPGAGKSHLATALGVALGAPVVSVDPIEAAMWRAGVGRDQPTGLAAYVVAEEVAAGVLALGQTVIVDAVNDVEPARGQWRRLAAAHGVALRFVEVVCSDAALHRRRLAGRRRGLDGFPEPTWADVERRRAGFEAWTDPRLVVDSAGDHEADLAAALVFVRTGAPSSV
ncbi:ATP-binding protein [Jiangella rhizosphaerae]|uniref:ATP-binding protein n=2 Tax=Jiangella rhizosphaerae TaxID=2293569 RepID=A0A418KW19_9ACTN|nr:ATP-binding protein [Jiangella rhizosphaerae]